MGAIIIHFKEEVELTAGIRKINCCSWSNTASPVPSFLFLGPGFSPKDIVSVSALFLQPHKTGNVKYRKN